jgi:hypothetical protein
MVFLRESQADKVLQSLRTSRNFWRSVNMLCDGGVIDILASLLAKSEPCQANEHLIPAGSDIDVNKLPDVRDHDA